MKKIIYLVLLFVLPVKARVVMAPLFQDGMVLQQNSKANIWGWANPGSELKIVCSWNINDTLKVKVDSFGRWKGQLSTTKAGGPYNIYLCNGTNRDTLIEDVMLGEVWLCSGQSNMQYTYNHKLGNPEKEIPATNYPDIRIFTVPNIASYHLQDNCGGKWERCTPDVMRRSSAVAYFYARELHRNLNVPVGIVVSAWGGTNAEVWVKDSWIKGNVDIMDAVERIEPTPWWPKSPGVCYNSMIHPLVPFSFSGVVWYQGESNVGKGVFTEYDKVMRTLIDNWRNDFSKNLPFFCSDSTV